MLLAGVLFGIGCLARSSQKKQLVEIQEGCSPKAACQRRLGDRIKNPKQTKNIKDNSFPQAVLAVDRPVIQTMFRGGAARTGQTSFFITRNKPKIIWKFETGGPLFSSPAVDPKGNIYIGSLSGSFYSLSPEGELRWRKDLGDSIFSSPLLKGQKVIVGGDSDRIFSLFMDNGNEDWVFSLGPCEAARGLGHDSVNCDADSSPLVTTGDQIVFGGDALYQLSPRGALQWKVDPGQHARSSPAVAEDGTIFIGSSRGVHAFSPTGEARWTMRTRGACDSTPALLQRELLIIGCDDRIVYGISQVDGALKWKHVTRGAVRSSAAVTPEGLIYVGSDDRTLSALGRDGASLWSFRAEGAIRSSPIVDPQGTVVFGSQDNHLYALNAAGVLLWKVELGGDIDSSAAAAPQGTLYIGADDGALYALR